MGKLGIPPLLAAVRDTNRLNRASPALCLVMAYQTANDPESGKPVIDQCLNDKDPQVVTCTLMELLGPPPAWPDFTIPACIKLCRHTNETVRFWAMLGLERFGTNARPAIGVLQELLTDTNAHDRYAASNTLRKIAPDVFATNNISAVH
jgi:hypothetical protein